ncbi:hypothetical protein G7Z17_g11533 [Cylindrodendrum hubeiense]|uniref:Alcohol acetyltransferase n=1 Tax=Cylindrodendrum hubeiense TaxID=595255 RepID=A0A9P5H018_9HYPO|nr:hypothetical protein G7Z17_g11533 [Cylindrodendrum hubeiense]
MSEKVSTPGSKPRIIRRLGPLGPSHHEKLVEFWELAVADTILQHPLLQVGIIGRDTKQPAWVQIDHIDLTKHIKWRVVDNPEKYEDTFKQTLKEQLDTKYDSPETQPSWRMVVFKLEAENLLEVVYVWSHSNSDGTGGKIFHETLLQSLNRVRDDKNDLVWENHLVKTIATAQNLPPPQDSVCNFTISPSFAVTLLWKEFRPQMFAPKLPPHKLRAPIHLTPTGTQSRRLCIDNATLQNVLAACRLHKTTLTGLLHGITLVSLVSLLKEEAPATIISETPLNLRRYVSSSPPGYPGLEPTKMIGNFVTKRDHDHDQVLVSKIRDLARGASSESEQIAALEDVMWSVSTTVREELQAKLDMGLKNEICGLMKVVGDYRDYFKEQMKKPRHATFLVTNLGVIDGGLPSETSSDKTQDWTIQRAYFSLAANLVGPNLTISPLAVKNGPLMIGVSWQNEAVDTNLGEGAVAGLKTWLNHIGSKQ